MPPRNGWRVRPMTLAAEQRLIAAYLDGVSATDLTERFAISWTRIREILEKHQVQLHARHLKGKQE